MTSPCHRLVKDLGQLQGPQNHLLLSIQPVVMCTMPTCLDMITSSGDQVAVTTSRSNLRMQLTAGQEQQQHKQALTSWALSAGDHLLAVLGVNSCKILLPG